MKLFRVMLDTCVLLDFFLVYTKEDKEQDIPAPLKRSAALLRRLELSNFFNVMTSWHKWELRKKVMQLRLQQKFVESGYTPVEFGDARKVISLTDDEIKMANEAVFDIWKFCFRETKPITIEDRRKIEKITKQGFGFMDVILVMQSKKNKCDFFITKDKKLKASKYLEEQLGTKVIGIKEFMGKLRATKKDKPHY